MKKLKDLSKEELEEPGPDVLVCDSDEDFEKFMASLPARARRMAKAQRTGKK